MWVDESGGADADANSAGDELTVHVGGQEYQAEINYDANQDGTDDTAVIQHDDGTAQAFIDTNHDGVADQYDVLDSSGHVVSEAHYDDASGQWVDDHGGQAPGSDSPGQDSAQGEDIHADMPDGEVDAGHATIDTDHDGKPDTAVVQTKDGGTIAFTDKDGDGQADIAVQTDANGQTTTFEHTGHGQWTPTTGSSGMAETSHGAYDPAGDAAWGAPGTETLDGVAKIDSGTGQWISPN